MDTRAQGPPQQQPPPNASPPWRQGVLWHPTPDHSSWGKVSAQASRTPEGLGGQRRTPPSAPTSSTYSRPSLSKASSSSRAGLPVRDRASPPLPGQRGASPPVRGRGAASSGRGPGPPGGRGPPSGRGRGGGSAGGSPSAGGLHPTPGWGQEDLAEGGASPQHAYPPGSTPPYVSSLKPLPIPYAIPFDEPPQNHPSTQQTLPDHPQPCQSSGSCQPPPQQPLIQLPISYRRALHKLSEAMQQSAMLLEKGQEHMPSAAAMPTAGVLAGSGPRDLPQRGRGGGSGLGGGGGGGDKGGSVVAVTDGLAQAVSRSGRSFGMSLESYYGTAGVAGTASAGAGDAGGARASKLPVQQKRAQVQFASLVAAHTWLIQALRELAQQGCTSSGVPPESLLALLAAISSAMPQYDTAIAGLGATASLGIAVGDGVNSSLQEGAAEAARLDASGCGELGDKENMEAAIRWRNRFLRALVAQEEATLGREDPHAPKGAPNGRGQTSGLALNATRRGHAPRAVRRADNAMTSVSPADSHRMPQPLGLWLPDLYWEPLAAPASTGWRMALPSGSHPWQPSLNQGAAFGRSQQQLQLYLMQLHLEAGVASSLIPDGPPPSTAEVERVKRVLSGGAAASALMGYETKLNRYIARCRLANMFLSKAAWNKGCCIVHLDEEQQQGVLQCAP
eukprot:gene30338-35336_t